MLWSSGNASNTKFWTGSKAERTRSPPSCSLRVSCARLGCSGDGLADTRSIHALFDHALTELHADRVFLMNDDLNTKSWRRAERAASNSRVPSSMNG